MQLKDYSERNMVSLSDFMMMDDAEALQFDFLTQGMEPDRAGLINSIYHRVFPWFDESREAGDTLSTYRTAVKRFYGHNYRYLSRSQQLAVISIIERWTPHDDGQIFEYESVDKKGCVYYQLCNNYQLGNFGIMPMGGVINPRRAWPPYWDYMDRFLESLYEYYDGTLSVTTPLAKSIMEQDYFQQFSDIRDYIERNLMWDYLQYDEDQDGTPISVLRLLSAAETFEDYVRMVTAIVQHRGGQMLALLRSTVTNDIASV